jgi:hypothetical protein
MSKSQTERDFDDAPKARVKLTRIACRRTTEAAHALAADLLHLRVSEVRIDRRIHPSDSSPASPRTPPREDLWKRISVALAVSSRPVAVHSPASRVEEETHARPTCDRRRRTRP